MTQTRRVEKLLQPATRQKALQAARTFQHRVFSSTGPVDCYGLASEAVQGIFTNLSQPEINVLVTVVLSDTLRATEENSREIEEELHKMNQAQLELREDIRAIERLAARGRTSRANSQDATKGVTISGLKSLLDDWYRKFILHLMGLPLWNISIFKIPPAKPVMSRKSIEKLFLANPDTGAGLSAN